MAESGSLNLIVLEGKLNVCSSVKCVMVGDPYYFPWFVIAFFDLDIILLNVSVIILWGSILIHTCVSVVACLLIL